jgi:hypothetical protein
MVTAYILQWFLRTFRNGSFTHSATVTDHILQWLLRTFRSDFREHCAIVSATFRNGRFHPNHARFMKLHLFKSKLHSGFSIFEEKIVDQNVHRLYLSLFLFLPSVWQVKASNSNALITHLACHKIIPSSNFFVYGIGLPHWPVRLHRLKGRYDTPMQ